MSYQICKRCIMDTSDPEISFDADGNCNHCNNALERLKKFYIPDERGEEALQKLIFKMKKSGEGKTYDCIIGLSGGVDSSYLAFKTKDWGLRPLIFHVDGGWNTEESEANVKHLAEYLGYDLKVYTVNWAEMRDLQIAFFKASLANLDVPQDHLFFAVLFKYAEKNGIKYWLSGSNLVTESILPVSWGYTALDRKQLLAVHKLFGTHPLKEFPTLSFWDYCKFYGNIPFAQSVEALKPLNLISYEPSKAKKEMQEAFGWRNYGRKHDESRFTRLFQNYILPAKFGYEKRRAHLASLIISGIITREEALQMMKEPLYSPDLLAEDIAYVCHKLEISQLEFEKLMNLPNKTYKDYPNFEGMITVGRKIKRLIVRPGQV